MSEAKGRVIVIGGGITGLAAAYYLQKESREKGNTLEVTLIEASHRLGGKIQTATNDGGYVIEKGPDSFLARKQSASRLIKEVGLQDKLVYNSSGKSYVLVKGKLHPMPGGSIMGIPTQIAPFITTGLFSPWGKVRASADFFLPATQTKGDLSLGQFFRRRLGDEVVENLIEPLLSGIYAGDIDNLSLMSTFPQFYQVEQKHGSLIKGMRHAAPPKPLAGSEGQKPKGMFLTVSSGLQSLVERIEEKLEKGSVYKGIRVEKIEKRGNGYEVHLNNSTVLGADSIVLATPHLATAAILENYHFASSLKEMEATSVATVALAYPESAIKKDIDGTGFVVSRNNDYTITACTWTHKKWPHSTPKGKVLLRCYVGKAGDEAIVNQTDEEIIKVVLDDLNKTMDIDSSPELTMVTRWKDSMPQYTVGHKERIAELLQQMKNQLPGVFLAGSSYSGLGIPDCIDQGEEAVSNVVNFLKELNKDVVGAN